MSAKGTRRTAKREIIEVVSEVCLPITVMNCQTATSIIESTLSHILFMREQIPDPIQVIRQILETESVDDVKLTRQRQKLAKLLKYFDEVQAAIAYICSNSSIRDVNFVIGATVTSPRELYILHFPEKSNWDFAASISDRARNECCRRVVREMVGKWSEVYSRYAPPVATNAYVAILPHAQPDSVIPYEGAVTGLPFS